MSDSLLPERPGPAKHLRTRYNQSRLGSWVVSPNIDPFGVPLPQPETLNPTPQASYRPESHTYMSTQNRRAPLGKSPT